MNAETLPEALAGKIQAITRSNKHIVRRVTPSESETIKSLAGWQHGWFRSSTGHQIVLEERNPRPAIIFCIGRFSVDR